MGSSLSKSAQADPQLTRHINDLYPTLGQLEEAASSLETLVRHPGWFVLIELLDAEVATIDRELDSGRVLESRSEYAARHGRRGGLRAAPELVAAVMARYAEKADEQRRKHERVAGSAQEV